MVSDPLSPLLRRMVQHNQQEIAWRAYQRLRKPSRGAPPLSSEQYGLFMSAVASSSPNCAHRGLRIEHDLRKAGCADERDAEQAARFIAARPNRGCNRYRSLA